MDPRSDRWDNDEEPTDSNTHSYHLREDRYFEDEEEDDDEGYVSERPRYGYHDNEHDSYKRRQARKHGEAPSASSQSDVASTASLSEPTYTSRDTNPAPTIPSRSNGHPVETSDFSSMVERSLGHDAPRYRNTKTYEEAQQGLGIAQRLPRTQKTYEEAQRSTQMPATTMYSPSVPSSYSYSVPSIYPPPNGSLQFQSRSQGPWTNESWQSRSSTYTRADDPFAADKALWDNPSLRELTFRKWQADRSQRATQFGLPASGQSHASEWNLSSYIPTAETTITTAALGAALIGGAYLAENGLPDVTSYIPSMPSIPIPLMPSVPDLSAYAPDFSQITSTAGSLASTAGDFASSAYSAAKDYAPSVETVFTVASGLRDTAGHMLQSVGSALSQKETLEKIGLVGGIAGTLLNVGSGIRSWRWHQSAEAEGDD